MKIFSNTDKFDIKNPVITIGSFDGVHKGHLKVISRLKEIAKSNGGESVIFTFSPHPRQVLYPEESKVKLLNTRNEKMELLENAGIDNIIFYPFTKEFAGLSYADFIKEVLIGQIGMKHLVVGYDHRLGSNREGSYEKLLLLSEELNFDIVREDAFNMDDVNISSTKIRNALSIGDVCLANSFLGYEYFLTGEVVKGDCIGRKIGFPTANIKLYDDNKLVPASGVYAADIFIDDKEYKGMVNMGIRPTVSHAGKFTIEANIFNFSEEIYGKKIRVSFVERLRGERRFESVDELKSQIVKDKVKAQKIFSSRG